MKGLSLLLLLASALLPTRAFANSPTWVEARSPHFIVMTDSNAKQAVHLADQFERMRAVLHTLFPNARVDAPAPILVLALKDQKAFKALEPADYLKKGQLNLAGYFQPGPEKNYILLRLDAQQEHPFATVYHEYTHFALSGAQDTIPLWLNEGMAEFFQNTDIHDKDVALGQPSFDDVLYLRQNRLIPLPVLFKVDHNSPYYHEENKGSVFYAESWALVHYIEVEDRQHNQARIPAYARLLAQKLDPVTAAVQAFGDLDRLQRGLETYIHEESFRYFRMLSPKTPDPASFQVATVSATDANALRAEFLAYNGRAADARTLLDGVLKQDPNNAVACETLGYMALHNHDMEGARKWLTQAVKLDSRSYLANFYYANMAMNDGLSEAPAIEASLKAAIKLNPVFAPSYDRLAGLYRMQHEHLEDAHLLELQAMQLDPSNLYYRMNAAYLLVDLNRNDDAVRVLDAARAFAKDPAQNALLDQAVQQVQMVKSGRAAQAVIMQQVAAPSLPERPSAAPSAAQHQVRGVLAGVRCGGASGLELRVQPTDGKPVALYSNNYFKIEFSAVNEAPSGDMSPCKDLEGRNALVTYAETADKSTAGEIRSVQLGGAVNEHIAAAANAPKHEARGTIHNVRCGPPSILEMELDGGTKTMAFFTNDYYKISFLAMNYQPHGEIHPCTDLEGKHAIVLYATTDDKNAAGEIVSIALSH